MLRIIWEMPIKAMRCHLIPVKMSIIQSIGADVERRESFHTVSRSVSWYSHQCLLHQQAFLYHQHHLGSPPTSRCSPLISSCKSNSELPIPPGVFLSHLSHRPPVGVLASHVKMGWSSLGRKQSLSSVNCMPTHRHWDAHHCCEQVYSQRLLLGSSTAPNTSSSSRPPWLLERI